MKDMTEQGVAGIAGLCSPIFGLCSLAALTGAARTRSSSHLWPLGSTLFKVLSIIPGATRLQPGRA